MNIVKMPLNALRKPERNMRMHPEAQIREYCRSVEKNGQLKLLVIDEDNVIWIGNGLYEALTRCGYWKRFEAMDAHNAHADAKSLRRELKKYAEEALKNAYRRKQRELGKIAPGINDLPGGEG